MLELNTKTAASTSESTNILYNNNQIIGILLAYCRVQEYLNITMVFLWEMKVFCDQTSFILFPSILI